MVIISGGNGVGLRVGVEVGVCVATGVVMAGTVEASAEPVNQTETVCMAYVYTAIESGVEVGTGWPSPLLKVQASDKASRVTVKNDLFS
jgi:hypothetical protein